MEDQYVGEIRIFAGNYAPQGWEFCAGQQLSIGGNEALFSLIGNTYGGDGINTFALPDLRGRLPIAASNGQTGTQYVLGQMGGMETVTLTQAQLPEHTHSVRAEQVAATESSLNNAVWANTGDSDFYSENTPDSLMNQNLVMSSGGNQSHDNMMPFLTLSFIIALQGIYPTAE